MNSIEAVRDLDQPEIVGGTLRVPWLGEDVEEELADPSDRFDARVVGDTLVVNADVFYLVGGAHEPLQVSDAGLKVAGEIIWGSEAKVTPDNPVRMVGDDLHVKNIAAYAT